MRTNNFKKQTEQIPSEGRAAENTFHESLAHFFDVDNPEGHISSVNRILYAFVRTAVEYPTTRGIADMVAEVDELKEFVLNVESACLNSPHLMSDEQARQIRYVLGGVGAKRLVSLLKDGLQDWIVDDNNADYCEDYKAEAIPDFWRINDLIKLCYEIHEESATALTEEGGVSC